MSNSYKNLIFILSNINSFCTSRDDNFSKTDKFNYFEALKDLAENLQQRLITISNATGSQVKIVLGSHDAGHFENEACYVWSDPLLYIDDVILHFSSPSLYNFAQEHWFHLNQELKEITQDFSILGHYCVSGNHNIIDEVQMTIERENIEITASVQLRENVTETIKA